MAALITHVAFYAGWPHTWAAFNLAKEVYAEDAGVDSERVAKGMGMSLAEYAASIFFPVGEENVGYAQYFTGRSYLAEVAGGQLPIYNVTFEPGCRNFWHIHHASAGGGQFLLCVGAVASTRRRVRNLLRCCRGARW